MVVNDAPQATTRYRQAPSIHSAAGRLAFPRCGPWRNPPAHGGNGYDGKAGWFGSWRHDEYSERGDRPSRLRSTLLLTRTIWKLNVSPTAPRAPRSAIPPRLGDDADLDFNVVANAEITAVRSSSSRRRILRRKAGVVLLRRAEQRDLCAVALDLFGLKAPSGATITPNPVPP
jgi:hypothetical protein